MVVLQWPQSLCRNLPSLQESRMASHVETAGGQRSEGLKSFLAAREFLLQHREDYETAYRLFRWPQLHKFNWALDYFDTYARGNNKRALWIVDENGREATLSFAEISRRS